MSVSTRYKLYTLGPYVIAVNILKIGIKTRENIIYFTRCAVRREIIIIIAKEKKKLTNR